MADKKISQLSSASTPLAGTEVLPIVQSNNTVKVASDDLTVKNVRSNASTGILQVAGPAAASTRVMTVPNANFTVARTDAANSFTGDQTLATGNLVQGTAAKGIDFSANTAAAGMTSELLNWYEEGTFTPTFTNLTVVGTPTYTGTYVRIGRMVYFNLRIQSTTSTSSTAGSTYANSGFPFVSANIYTVTSSINTSTFAVFANEGLVGLSGGNTILYTPTWSALADVTITGFYFV